MDVALSGVEPERPMGVSNGEVILASSPINPHKIEMSRYGPRIDGQHFHQNSLCLAKPASLQQLCCPIFHLRKIGYCVLHYLFVETLRPKFDISVQSSCSRKTSTSQSALGEHRSLGGVFGQFHHHGSSPPPPSPSSLSFFSRCLLPSGRFL